MSPDHPRIRGEHCTPLSGINNAQGSSPHTRGAHPLPRTERLGRRIIPAYAGSTSVSPFFPNFRRGSSPHTRGAHPQALASGGSCGIIPAYAGSTSSSFRGFRSGADHPRIRGEHVFVGRERHYGDGSSPHTRGAHLEIPAIPRIAAVIIPVFLYPSPTPQEEADRSMVLLTLS